VQNLGQLIDALGLQVELEEGELISGAVVILETIEADGDVTMQIIEDEKSVSWVKRLGMLKAALEVSMADIGSGHHRHHDHDLED